MDTDLTGWRQIRDLPSANDLTELYRRHHQQVPRRADLVAVAMAVPGYHVHSNLIVNGREHCGLTFYQNPSGSVLLAVPLYSDVAREPVGVYIIGDANVVHASGTVRTFQEALEREVLPAVAQVGDDP